MKLFLTYINGEIVGVMTFKDALQYAWEQDHARLYLEDITPKTTIKDKRG